MLASLAPRSSTEEHRVSTPLELFLDLCFVVAVAQAATTMHHAVADGHVATALVGYPMVFFAIWWAWMNITWFASAYDNDDVGYRLAIFVQVLGVLVLAAGVPRAFESQQFGVIVVGYVIMRVSMVGLWLRAAAGDPARRATCMRYAGGITAVQILWVALLVMPSSIRLPMFLTLVVAELAIPVWSERAGATPWHPQHIAERYGLFTIIVLGESILGGALAMQAAISDGESLAGLTVTGIGAVVLVCAMWWLYFNRPSEALMERARDQVERQSSRSAFLWGYGHYAIFSAVAATGAGIAVAIDVDAHVAHVSTWTADLSIAVPLAIYVCAMGLLHRSQVPRPRMWPYPVGAALILAYAVTGGPILGFGVLVILVIAGSATGGDRSSVGGAAEVEVTSVEG